MQAKYLKPLTEAAEALAAPAALLAQRPEAAWRPLQRVLDAMHAQLQCAQFSPPLPLALRAMLRARWGRFLWTSHYLSHYLLSQSASWHMVGPTPLSACLDSIIDGASQGASFITHTAW